MSLTIEKCLQAWINSLRQMNARADIVFFGDSLTYYGDFASVFPDKVVCNLGLRGDTIQGMIDRVEMVKILKPKSVYLMAGLNDVTHYNVEEFNQHYEKLLEEVSEVIDNGVLIIQSMLPVDNIDFSINCGNDQISACNAMIRRTAFARKLNYIDLYTQYIVDGILPKTKTRDGIHLYKDAYSEWYKAVKEL